MQKVLDLQDGREEFLIKQTNSIAERNLIKHMLSSHISSVKSFFAEYDIRKLISLVEEEVVVLVPVVTEKTTQPKQADFVVVKKKPVIEFDSEKTKRIDSLYDEENVTGNEKKDGKKKSNTLKALQKRKIRRKTNKLLLLKKNI
jgi:hypothetical protein